MDHSVVADHDPTGARHSGDLRAHRNVTSLAVMDESQKAIKALKLGADDYLVESCAVDCIRDAVAHLVRNLDGR